MGNYCFGTYFGCDYTDSGKKEKLDLIIEMTY